MFKGKGKCGRCSSPIRNDEPVLKVVENGILKYKCYNCAMEHTQMIRMQMHGLESFMINGMGKVWEQDLKEKVGAAVACANRTNTAGRQSINQKNYSNGNYSRK